MLLKMRGGLDSIFVTILLGVLIAAFAIWGIGPGIIGGNQSVVADVGNQQIGANRYFRAVQSQASQLQQQFGGQMSTNELVRTFGLDDQVLSQMVAEAALAAEASALGLRATDDQVIEGLKSIEGLRAPDGSLNAGLMAQILATNGLTEQDLLDDIRAAIVRDQMITSLIASTPTPRLFAETLQVFRGERRDGTLINVGLEDVGEVVAPDQSTLEAWFADRADNYKSPELRSYRYVLVNPAFYQASVEISEEELAEEYARRERDYVTPEVRNIDQVTLPTLEAANALISAVAAGGDFVAEAAAASPFTPEEITLGDQEKAMIDSDFGPEIADAVFALEANSVSAPLEGFAGFNVFRVRDITPGSGRTLEEVRGEIEGFIRTDKGERALFDAMGEIEDTLADDPVLDPLAEKFGFTVASVTDVDAQGRTIDQQPVVTSQVEARILREAANLRVGDEPELFNINPGDIGDGYFLLELTDVKETAERPLEDVRARVVDDWIEAERRARAATLAETILARLRAGEAADAIVGELGGVSFVARNVARQAGEGAQVSPNIRQLLFDLAPGAADLDAAADGNGYVIARADEVRKGDPTDIAAVDSHVAELKDAFLQEVLMQYQTYLLAKYPASVNRTLINQLFDPENAAF